MEFCDHQSVRTMMQVVESSLYDFQGFMDGCFSHKDLDLQ